MTEQPKLEELRAVAEAATQGPWEQSMWGSRSLPWTVEADDGKNVVAHTYKRPEAVFIATFDPPTVLSLLSRIAVLEGERDEAIRKQKHTEYWYAVRLEPIKDVAKREGIWPEIAAIIANGSSTRQTPDGVIYVPPTYAQQLNIAEHRAQSAEARVSALLEEKGEGVSCTDIAAAGASPCAATDAQRKSEEGA